MQMPISSATPSPSSGTASPTAAKGTESGNFIQTFVQTIAGSQGKGATAQDGSEAAASSGVVVTNTLASLLGNNVSAVDLLSTIEALLQKLGDTDTEQLAETTTESNLADALQQLDNLLSVLTGVPLMQQPAIDVKVDTAAVGATSDDATGTGDALLALLANMNGVGAQNASSVQAAETVVPNQSQATVANLEELNALKSGLQEALTDLRSMLQDQKGTSVNRDQVALISKELSKVEELISGTPITDANAISNTNTVDTVDSVRSLQTMPQTNSHLQRMAHQLLHVGMLNVVKKPEAKGTEPESLKQSASDPNDMNLLAGANMDLQRQLAAVSKPVIAQPVPVQQFASTIQGLVVKQFNVSTVNGVSQAQLTLYPEHLGQVNVNISVHNGTLTAQFVTDTVTAKDMLENQMAQLRSALQSQGLQVDKLVVSQTSVQPNMFQDRQGHQGQNQESAKRNKSQSDAIDEIDFTTDLEEMSMQLAAERDLGLGRGIHTIA